MTEVATLSLYLAQAARLRPELAACCQTVDVLAGACAKISALVALGSLAGEVGAAVGHNADGDSQKQLDVITQQIVADALAGAPVAAIASEEMADWRLLDADAPIAVAFDPLDGSSNIDTNMSIGTIFSVRPAQGGQNPFAGPGAGQLAAGFVVYGPQTMLALTLGSGVDIFTLDPRDQTFRLTRPQVKIPGGTFEYAINASNYRHWEEPVRVYIDDCLNGADGLRATNFNMRWIGSLVAEAFRILTRGGVFLYPADRRKGYENGRLRLLYEAHPIAFLMEQAGGAATDGRRPIQSLSATTLHQRVPLIFGAASKVDRIERLHHAPEGRPDESPLFGRRGLFRA